MLILLFLQFADVLLHPSQASMLCASAPFCTGYRIPHGTLLLQFINQFKRRLKLATLLFEGSMFTAGLSFLKYLSDAGSMLCVPHKRFLKEEFSEILINICSKLWTLNITDTVLVCMV